MDYRCEHLMLVAKVLLDSMATSKHKCMAKPVGIVEIVLLSL